VGFGHTPPVFWKSVQVVGSEWVAGSTVLRVGKALISHRLQWPECSLLIRLLNDEVEVDGRASWGASRAAPLHESGDGVLVPKNENAGRMPFEAQGEPALPRRTSRTP